MKPRRIILVRHGESIGNTDKSHFSHTANHRLALTERGKKQAQEAAKGIALLIGNESLSGYYSPWTRAADSFHIISEVLAGQVVSAREDPRLREQSWGHYKNLDLLLAENERRIEYGKFYFRPQDGESGADVYDRISTFLETLHRDFAKPDYPDNTLIVGHGVTLLVFLMRWLHWSVEEFEDYRTPGNAQLVVLSRNQNGKYDLTTPLVRRSSIPQGAAMQLAIQVFGNTEKATMWLNTSNPILGGDTPFSRLRGTSGTESVLKVLRKIESGEFIS